MNALAGKWGGRHAEPSFSGKLSIRRVRLDRGGYDFAGRYLGVGAPVYAVGDEWGQVDFTLRAGDREAAKSIVAAGYPYAKIR